MNQYRRTLIVAALLIGTPMLMASNCATAPQQGQVEEFAVDYCDELLPAAEAQMADTVQQQGADTERVTASVTGPFGETVEMEIEVESGHSFTDEQPEYETMKTGLSDLVLNCGTDPLDDRTCAVEVYLDSEMIGRGNFQTRGQLPMRCIPAGQRELRIVDIAGRAEIYRDVITIESDREYMAQVVEKSPTNTIFEFYAESDLTHGFALPVDSEGNHAEQSAGPVTASSQDAPPAGAQPMYDADFDELVARVADASFSSDRQGLIEDAMAHNYFTARQAATLLEQLSSSMTQEELAIEFYPLVVDRERFHIVVDAIDSSISRNNVRDELGL